MRVLTIGLLAAIPLFAQNSLVLSSGGSALNLTLTSRGGVQPAAIQWTLTYSSNELLSIKAVVAGSAAAAGKTINCAGHDGNLSLCTLRRELHSDSRRSRRGGDGRRGRWGDEPGGGCHE